MSLCGTETMMDVLYVLLVWRSDRSELTSVCFKSSTDATVAHYRLLASNYTLFQRLLKALRIRGTEPTVACIHK